LKAEKRIISCGHLVQPAQHPACSEDSLPSAVQWFGGAVPSPPQRGAPGLLCHGKLNRSPAVGAAGHPFSGQRRRQQHTHSGSVRLTTVLILPGQFLDSPELPSDEFLTQFSPTLSTTKHHYTRLHYTAATQQPPSSHPAATAEAARCPAQCTDSVFIRRDRHIPRLRSGTRQTRCPHPG
jgi:hypothetical protein